MYIEQYPKILHVEWTSLCNARCPQCARTENSYLPLEQWTLEKCKSWFPKEMLTQTEHVYSCGNYGDPIVHPNCIDFFDWFIDAGVKRCAIHTNGGARDIEFWQELGKRKIRAVFGIDGLEDTNHIYRVGVDWNKLMRNVEAFINAGGEADWAFLIFEYNHHQVDDARILSEKLGFKNFRAKVTNRFLKLTGNKIEIVNSKSTKTKEAIAPSNEITKHLTDAQKALNSYSTYDEYVKNTEIECKTKLEQSLYVDFQGKVWPCCWLGHHYDKEGLAYNNVLFNKYGATFNDLHHHTLTSILDNEWFKAGLEQSWNNTDRLPVCGKTCGKIYKSQDHILWSKKF